MVVIRNRKAAFSEVQTAWPLYDLRRQGSVTQNEEGGH